MFPLRVGLFGIGLDAYWRQFAGLKERLEQNVRLLVQKLQRPGVEIVNFAP
jgi:L-arabinose isomerase